MRYRVILAACAVGAAMLGASAASASIYAEDFNAAGFQGSRLNLSGADLTSDRWANTDYFNINDFDGWTFGGGAYLAQQTGTPDGALLLNENGGLATNVIGLTAGQTYAFSFLLSGDNRPGSAYVFNAAVNGVTHVYNGTDGAAGTNPGTVESFKFTPTGSTATVFLSQGSRTEASPIIDNISITAVPEPSTWGLMLMGFGLAGAALRRGRAYRLVEFAADGRASSEEFSASDDKSALAQALSVAEGVAVEVWRGATLVERCELQSAAA